MIDSKFWQGKRVFLTGHTGFKGTWLGLWLEQMGAEVHGYSLAPNTTPSFYNLINADRLFKSSTLADIGDARKLAEALTQANPEIVLHMAAQPLVRASYKDPLWTYQTNVMGTANILNACRTASQLKAILIITTDKVYENKDWDWGYREIDRLGGFDPYSNSKACAELVTDSFRSSYFSQLGIGLATARAGNVFGGGDFSEDRLVPDLLRSIESGKNLVIRSPQSTRPWQHVLVPLSGYLNLAQKLYAQPQKHSSAYNLGPIDEDCVSVAALLKEFSSCWKKELPVTLESAPQPHEARLLKLDISKAKQDLNWSPSINLKPGVELAVEWYQSYLEKADLLKMSQQQIQNFIGTLK